MCSQIAEIKKRFAASVETLTLDLGQKDFDSSCIERDLKKAGADEVHFFDAKEKFITEYVLYALKSNADVHNPGRTSTALHFSLLAEIAIETATRLGVDTIMHGCVMGSFEQFYLEGEAAIRNPDSRIYALEYIGFAPQENTHKNITHENVWAKTKELSTGSDNDQDAVTKSPQISPTSISITFDHGIPTHLNHKNVTFYDCIEQLSIMGERFEIGFRNVIEDTVVGQSILKSYQAPAAAILARAHQALENRVCTEKELEFKQIVDLKWRSLIKTTLWHEPLRLDLDVFIENVQKKVTGTVHLQLERNTITILSVETNTVTKESALAELRLTPETTQHYIKLSAQRIALLQKPQPTALVSIGTRKNKVKLLGSMKQLSLIGYKLYATYKTHKFLQSHGVPTLLVHKISQPQLKPNLSDLLAHNRFDVIIQILTKNNPTGKEKSDDAIISEFAEKYHTRQLNTVKETRSYIDQLSKNI